MNDTEPGDRGRVVPLDRYPGPAVSYTLDGGPTIGTANDAFESTFGATTPGAPVEAQFETLRVSLPESPDPLPELLGEPGSRTVPIETEDTAYVARIQPPVDDAFGYVFFDEWPPRTGSANAAGANRPEGTDGTADSGVDVERVASVLSHDLRNPLDVAKARLRAGRETGADEHFERVERAHRRMERIIEDVLTLSRGSEYVTPERSVDLSTAVESAWETVETGAATLTVDEVLPTAVVDRDRVERLFENLFRNAVEHGDRPDVTVGRLDGDEEGFYVADDGPGVPPGERTAVFDPGYSSSEHGTGLGLSIVKRIAECHGWTVDVTDGSSGARFEFRGIEPDA